MVQIVLIIDITVPWFVLLQECYWYFNTIYWSFADLLQCPHAHCSLVTHFDNLVNYCTEHSTIWRWTHPPLHRISVFAVWIPTSASLACKLWENLFEADEGHWIVLPQSLTSYCFHHCSSETYHGSLCKGDSLFCPILRMTPGPQQCHKHAQVFLLQQCPGRNSNNIDNIINSETDPTDKPN